VREVGFTFSTPNTTQPSAESEEDMVEEAETSTETEMIMATAISAITIGNSAGVKMGTKIVVLMLVFTTTMKLRWR
jgi:hypothetical protein